MIRFPRLRQLAAVTGASALVLVGAAACQGDANTISSSPGVLVIQGDAGNPTLTEDFNPFSATQLGGTRLIYEPLEVASSVNGDFIPFLATGHHFVNAKTLVFTLRPGEKWSDGQPVTAKDVLYTFDLLKKNPALDLTGVWSQLSDVTATATTVTMTFKQPSVPFAGVVAAVPIVPEHIWSRLPGNLADFTDTTPVGSGPFKLGSFTPTEYTLTKNPYWQGSAIAPTSVRFPAQSTNQSTNQLEVSDGSYDWAYNYLPDVTSTYLGKRPGNRIWFPPGGDIALFLNLTKPLYQQVSFRKGISLALDRRAIAAKAVDGYTGPASLSGLILPNEKKYLDSSLPRQGLVSQDTSAAIAAFRQAGLTERGGTLMNGSKPVTMTIEAPNNYSDWVAAAAEVKTELAKVGISVTLDLPQAAQYEKDISAGSFDAAFGGFGGTGSPYLDFNNAFNSAFATPVNTPTANNFERFKSPAVDADLASLAAATSPAVQQQATHKLEQFMYTQVPIIPLYYGGSWGLYSTRHFTGWPSAADPYMLPTPYNNALLVVVTRLQKA